MLVYIVAFGLAVNLMISLLGTGSRLAALSTLGLGRMEGIRAVQDTFTSYTRRAVAVESSVGDYVSGEHRLVLKMPPGQAEGFDFVVLGALQRPDQFGVLGLASGAGGLETVYLETLRQPLETIYFTTDASGTAPVVHLDLMVKGEEGERERPFPQHRSSVALRGVGS